MLSADDQKHIHTFAQRIISKGGINLLRAVIAQLTILAEKNTPTAAESAGKILLQTHPAAIARADGRAERALAALASYGAGAAVRIGTLAADLEWEHAQCGRVFSALESMGYVTREKRNNITKITMRRLPDGITYGNAKPAPAEPVKRPPSRALAPSQIIAIEFLVNAGAKGLKVSELAPLMKTRPGPLTRCCSLLELKGFAVKTGDGHYVATRHPDGTAIDRNAHDAVVTFENGVRVTRYKTPRPARGYGAGVTAVTVLPTGRGPNSAF